MASHLSRHWAPADCAIAVAIPLSGNEWLREYAAGTAREYARFYRDGLGVSRLPPRDTAVTYERLEAGPIRRCLDETSRLGATVIPNCGVTELQAAARKHHVVVLVAHWRSGLLYADQVTNWDAFLDLLKSDTSTIMTRLRAGIGSCERHIPGARAGDPGARAALLAALNEAIGCERLAVSPNPNELTWPRAFILDENRTALNQCCAGCLDATSGVELADDTHPAEDVAAAVGAMFSGELDFTVCFSAVLGERVKAVATRARIMTNREMTTPRIRLPFVRETIRVLHSRPGSYIDTAREIRNAFLNRSRT